MTSNNLMDTANCDRSVFRIWCTSWLADGVDSFHPPEDSWMNWVVQNIGMEETIIQGLEDERPRGALELLLSYGIAPGQGFLVEFSGYNSGWSSGYESGPEWDEDWCAEIVAIEPWPHERVLRAWTAWTNGDTECEL